MLTYPRLGENGRLGNQLWQIAGTIGIAVLHDEEWNFPDWRYREFFSMPDEWFEGRPGTDASTLADRLPEAARPYLQDSYYVDVAKHIIREAFTLKPDAFIDDVAAIVEAETSTAVHVRRGDYAEEWRGHGMLARKWYLQHWPSGRVCVFSDDPDWCEENLPGEVMRFPEIDDFRLMTKFGRHLISNSSFAWWAAWISGGQVTYPDPWFRSAPVGHMRWAGWTAADAH
ncbi:MAG TPA: alpha-1,2-fucosyltransferase [Acidimicrobiia bacterium]